MRVPFLLSAVLLLAVLSGCLSGGRGSDDSLVSCDGDLHPLRLYLGPDHSLGPQVPESGSTPGNSFAGAFLTNGLDEWLSSSIVDPLHLEGNVSLVLFVEFAGTPAPIPQGDTGNGYQFFNQFGSDRTFQPGYATENAAAVQAPGTQMQFRETIALPPGGFELESGDRVRLLLTSLAADGPDGSGHDILYGSPTLSRLEVPARCTPARSYELSDDRLYPVSLLGNQGLFTGQIPASELNTVTLPLDLHNDTTRLIVDLTQGPDAIPVKDDIDLEIVDRNGTALWSIGSPYSNEHGVLWEQNLQWLREHGATGVRVNSYSGVAYQGTLTITQERDALAA